MGQNFGLLRKICRENEVSLRKHALSFAVSILSAYVAAITTISRNKAYRLVNCFFFFNSKLKDEQSIDDLMFTLEYFLKFNLYKK